ncbi:hypothetical protein DMH04_56245 [Kibdelosporangium aridum]|uniref:Uncharacterized protein n=1 Tax=Kibdelosporangium aridum TaxID=2030 RepID=A0A428XSS7_KIBAR|nr:hypothetical protein DMH04_56245 [Kibdelosporangium aridum]
MATLFGRWVKRFHDPLQFRSRIGLLILIQAIVDGRSMIIQRTQKDPLTWRFIQIRGPACDRRDDRI